MMKMKYKILLIMALIVMVLTISFFAMSVCSAEYVGNESTTLYELPQEQEEETSEIIAVVDDVIDNPTDYTNTIKDLIIEYLPIVLATLFSIGSTLGTYFKAKNSSDDMVLKLKERISKIDVSKTMKDQIDMCQRMLDENTELRKQIKELIEEIRRVKG